MKITAPKVFATCVITALGTSFFLMSPLWVGLCFIIPGFSLFIAYALKQDVKFSHAKPIPFHKLESPSLLGFKSVCVRKKHLGF